MASVRRYKEQLTETIWRPDFELNQPADDYAPGQFARLRVGDGEWRDYSIAGVDGRVTDALARLEFDSNETDFYLCGSAGPAKAGLVPEFL